MRPLTGANMAPTMQPGSSMQPAVKAVSPCTIWEKFGRRKPMPRQTNWKQSSPIAESVKALWRRMVMLSSGCAPRWSRRFS